MPAVNLDRLKFALDDDERRSLQAMLTQPGYGVLRKIQAAYVDAMKEGALNVSLAGGHTDEAIVEAWTHARVAQRMHKAFESGVLFELDVLRQKNNRPDDETLAVERQRRILEAI